MPFAVRTATPKQLDPIAEFLRGAQIFRRDRGDAFDIDRALGNLGAEREAGQDRKLLRGVVAIDVERRIGLGIAEPLRVLQAFGKRQAFLLHPGQDVIAGAVEDAVDAVDGGAGQPLAQRLDDGDRSAHRRLVIQRAAVLLGGLRQPHAVLGDQRLVGGDHRLAGFQRGLDRRQRRIAGTAHQFDEAVDAGIVGQRQRAFGPFDAAQIELALLHLRARGDGDDAHAAAAARRQRPRLLFDEADDFGANGAEPRYAHFQGCDHDQKNLREKLLGMI